jgi:hypothetical protein
MSDGLYRRFGGGLGWDRTGDPPLARQDRRKHRSFARTIAFLPDRVAPTARGGGPSGLAAQGPLLPPRPLPPPPNGKTFHWGEVFSLLPSPECWFFQHSGEVWEGADRARSGLDGSPLPPIFPKLWYTRPAQKGPSCPGGGNIPTPGGNGVRKISCSPFNLTTHASRPAGACRNINMSGLQAGMTEAEGQRKELIWQ